MDSNIRTIINYNTWERRNNFEFFKQYLNPFITITSEADCTEALQRSKETGTSFFLRYLYAILRAVNEIPELRYRIEKSEDDSHKEIIVLYKTISVITPIRVGENGRFHSVKIPYNKNFGKFYKTAREIIADIPAETDPYAAENEMKSGANKFLDIVLVSAIPELYFTSVTCTQHHRNGADKPLINVGKAVPKEGRMVMPVAVSFHHGLADGYHIALFFDKVNAYLKETAAV